MRTYPMLSGGPAAAVLERYDLTTDTVAEAIRATESALRTPGKGMRVELMAALAFLRGVDRIPIQIRGHV